MSYISLAIIVSFSMPKSSRALIISMTIPSGPLALFPFILDTAARISDCRIFGPSMFFRISGLPPLLSRNSSSIYSVHLSRMSSFSVIMVPSFERACKQLHIVATHYPLAHFDLDANYVPYAQMPACPLTFVVSSLTLDCNGVIAIG